MYGNYFKFQELIATSTNLPNDVLTDSHLANLASLWNTLNYLRDQLGYPIIVNSAYRTPAVNKQVGGAKRSLHMQGRAADIRCDSIHMEKLRSIVNKEKDNFSEVIYYPTFIHIAL